MNKKHALLVFLLTMGCTPKGPEFAKIVFHNNSNEFLKVSASQSYPDTSLRTNTTYAVDCDKVNPSSKCDCWTRLGWKNDIEANKSKKIIFYIFNLDSANKYGWPSIRDENKFAKRFILTQAQLESMNWTITYP